ncbi:MAG: hypothetical protein HY543_12965 [Deltaproteobacteria bacterium]|nr:hypothetical protein [Deltaproteobacteria bacterium]
MLGAEFCTCDDVASIVQTTDATFEAIAATVRRKHIDRTVSTFERDMDRLARQFVNIEWEYRKGMLQDLNVVLRALWDRRPNVYSPNDWSQIVADTFQGVLRQFFRQVDPNAPMTFDLVRFREAFVDVASVLVSDRRTLPQVVSAMQRRAAMLQLSVTTLNGLCIPGPTEVIVGWGRLPRLLQLAATEHVNDKLRYYRGHRKIMEATAREWLETWHGQDPARWMALLSALLRESLQEPSALVMAGWIAKTQDLFGRWMAAPTAEDLDRALKALGRHIRPV